MPPGARYVGRPGPYGNRFKVGEVNDNGKVVTAEDCLEYFEFDLRRKYPGNALKEFLEPLRGKDLACWCELPKPGEPDMCHGATLIRLANN